LIIFFKSDKKQFYLLEK